MSSALSTDGPTYKTPFYSCTGCSVMLLDLERFSRLMSKRPNGRGWLEDYLTKPSVGKGW